MSEILKDNILCIKNESTSLAKSEFAYSKLEEVSLALMSYSGSMIKAITLTCQNFLQN